MSILFPAPVISSLSSLALERYVAGIFQSNGYFVKRDLLWDESLVADAGRTVNILQADGLGYVFAPFGESKVLIECKGGGTFTDFFKFSGIANLVEPDSAFFICNNSTHFEEIQKIGEKQNINVLEPKSIIERFSIPGITDKINYWYWANELQDTLLNKDSLIAATGLTRYSTEQNAAFSEIKKYNAQLSKVWTEVSPKDQANLITKYFSENRDFVRKAWRTQGLKKAPDTENAINQNILCESAASIVLKAKVEYLITAVRCAITTLVSTNPNYLISITDTTFQAVVQKMIDSISLACRLPNFLQFWIFQFGGVLNMNNNEVSVLAKLINERDEAVLLYIAFLEDIFRVFGDINWGISKTSGILEFKGVPESIRGYGIYVREKFSIDITPFVYRVQWERRLKEITGYS